MIYSKLPVVLISTITSEKEGSTNSVIAEFILSNIEKVGNIGIKDLAAECNVAVSSISRFCKEIGLRDYSELKDIINNADFNFQKASESKAIDKRIQEYGERVKSSIDDVSKSIDYNKIKMLCRDIKKYKKVSIFGMMKAENAALNLLSDLLMLGKKANSKISYNEQMNYIEKADEEDLIIIFSYTGIYFDYKYRHIPLITKKPRIYLVTGGPNKYKDFVYEAITFSSKQDMLSHPYQLEFAAGYEEGESLFLTDILRRAGFTAHIVSTEGKEYVKGAHDIICKADKVLNDEIKYYDMIILPGGMPGAVNLRDNEEVIEMVKYFDKEEKYIGAICAAPMVLAKAEVSKGRKLTSYPNDKYRNLFTDAEYKEEIVVIDKNLITSRGPASTMDFAYAVVDLLGKDSTELKEKMLYNMVKNS